MKHGLIDLHTHGLGRYDTRTENPEAILKIAELHGRAGTVAFLPTIYPASINEMRRNIKAVKKAMEIQGARGNGKKSETKKLVTYNLKLATILGVHLEGPFLNPVRCGALDKKYFVKPSISFFEKVIDAFEDIIKIVTIAPELPGALKVIEKCSEMGIKVNMGHSDATYKEAVEGKKAGATGITHIFNAMRPFHHREPGLAGLGLLDSDLYIEVIADGVHLHPKTLELVFSKKRLDKIVLVSDSVKGAKGKPSFNKKGILTGSRITLSDSIRMLKGIRIPEAEIIGAAVDNPRRYISV